MKKKKQEIRAAFRKSVFERDKYRCQLCGEQATPEDVEEKMDAHHVTEREEMPFGGYVKENGITLCKDLCHYSVEMTGTPLPRELYKLIGSSEELARQKSEETLG